MADEENKKGQDTFFGDIMRRIEHLTDHNRHTGMNARQRGTEREDKGSK